MRVNSASRPVAYSEYDRSTINLLFLPQKQSWPRVKEPLGYHLAVAVVMDAVAAVVADLFEGVFEGVFETEDVEEAEEVAGAILGNLKRRL